MNRLSGNPTIQHKKWHQHTAKLIRRKILDQIKLEHPENKMKAIPASQLPYSEKHEHFGFPALA